MIKTSTILVASLMLLSTLTFTLLKDDNSGYNLNLKGKSYEEAEALIKEADLLSGTFTTEELKNYNLNLKGKSYEEAEALIEKTGLYFMTNE